MNGIELICFEIISNVGTARSMFIDAIQKAKEKNFAECEKLIEEGEEYFRIGHKAHAKLISNEADGTNVQVTLLLAHAEDQLMSAETFKLVAMEFIDLYKSK